MSVCPTVIKWQKIYDKMMTDGTPFSVSDLKISAQELIAIGYKKGAIGEELKRLFKLVVINPELNDKSALINLAKSDFADTSSHLTKS